VRGGGAGGGRAGSATGRRRVSRRCWRAWRATRKKDARVGPPSSSAIISRVPFSRPLPDGAGRGAARRRLARGIVRWARMEGVEGGAGEGEWVCGERGLWGAGASMGVEGIMEALEVGAAARYEGGRGGGSPAGGVEEGRSATRGRLGVGMGRGERGEGGGW